MSGWFVLRFENELSFQFGIKVYKKTENGTFSLQELIILKLVKTTLQNTFECSANIIKFYYFNIPIGKKCS